jgi:hypothetical protein
VRQVFQPHTTGYLITTVETIQLTGKRKAPIWLIMLTGIAMVVVLVGGILLLLFYRAGKGPFILDTFFGILALLVIIISPAIFVARNYLRLENSFTILRASILAMDRDAATLSLFAKVAHMKKPIHFVLLTRSEEEAMTIERNLSVSANGRLRVYPITYLPGDPWLLTKLAQKEIHLIAADKRR